MLPRCTTHTSCYAAVGSFGSGGDDDDDVDDVVGVLDDDGDDDVDIAYEIMISLLSLFISPIQNV